MDPNEALRKLRELVAEARADVNIQGYVNLSDATAILDQFEALDEWLSRGGFPPEAWREGPDAFGEANPNDGPAGDGWLYDSAHRTAAEQAARVRELSAARPDAAVEARTSDGGLFEVWIRPKGEAPARVEDIPEDWPVQPIRPVPGDREVVTCGHCGLSWDDALITSMTPAPSGRCPFESFHV